MCVTVVCKQIDKDGANAEVVMQELSAHGLMPEEWGGDTPMVQVNHLCRGILITPGCVIYLC